SSPQEPSPVVNCKVSSNAKETGNQRQWCLHHKTSLVARLPLTKESRVIKCKPRRLLCDINVGRSACKHCRNHECYDSENHFASPILQFSSPIMPPIHPFQTCPLCAEGQCNEVASLFPLPVGRTFLEEFLASNDFP